MKALVYLGPNQKALEDRPKPVVQASTDAIVKMTRTTICGTDLHILKGDVPSCTPGRILGHEGVGIVDELGASVTHFKVGDAVLISCVSACGKCTNCRRQMYSHRTTGGWILGLTVVKELVEAHGGTVLVRSPGRGLGSQFGVSLPASCE